MMMLGVGVDKSAAFPAAAASPGSVIRSSRASGPRAGLLIVSKRKQLWYKTGSHTTAAAASQGISRRTVARPLRCTKEENGSENYEAEVCEEAQASNGESKVNIADTTSAKHRANFSSANEGYRMKLFREQGGDPEYHKNIKFSVDHLRDKFDMPLIPSRFVNTKWRFLNDQDLIVTNARCENPSTYTPEFAVRAGPRIETVFEPSQCRAAIVTCGGLCPGLNNVIRSIVTTLDTYGVKEIFGIRYGFKGFYDWGKQSLEPLRLKLNNVQGINVSDVQAQGGTILGTSRGGSDTDEIVSSIKRMRLDMVFVIGGNGSHAGALAITRGCEARNIKCAIVGVPKTIDNDILMIDRTFGFDTAVEQAQMSIRAAAVEAKSAQRGIGVVKLMGRSSGFIAMHSTLASGEVDICLVPEVSFGQEEFLNYVESVLEKQDHCVVVVAEGAGQDLMLCSNEYDASGNPVLADIGRYLCDRIKTYFKNKSLPISLKYLDPTYAIRACAANATDAIYCNLLGQHAVHAAFAGYTNVTVGLINNCYAYLPIPEVIKETGNIDPRGRRWSQLVASTGQPSMLSEEEGPVPHPQIV